MPQVYRLNENDWVIADNFNEAVNWYMKDTGMSKEEAVDESYSPFEVKDLSRFYIIVERYDNKEFEEEYLEDEDDNTLSIPADELIKKEWKGKPFIFCSTEY
ncbi:hypothetical protein LCM23_25545 [Cytobacillus kochii]|uniref:hypothetical protein n=1 Tax=Cytobacillus kochii TaxID=859143 RepID=UPI001CD1A73B|nr:hypothetical protein [Cytobacillus kochii]MCA1029380.1 hypothetical protein [Cytobacillus kochii]